MIPFNRGSTADKVRNFGNADLHAGLRSEYLPAEKDNVSAEAEQRESRKEIGSPTKKDLDKFQCRFRIEPEIPHKAPFLPRRCVCDGGRFERMPAEVNRARLVSFSLLSIAVTV